MKMKMNVRKNCRSCPISPRMQRSTGFLIWKVAARLVVVALFKCAGWSQLTPVAVSWLHCGCGVLPQHLDTIYDIPDALDAPALASTWLNDSVSRPSPYSIF